MPAYRNGPTHESARIAGDELVELDELDGRAVGLKGVDAGFDSRIERPIGALNLGERYFSHR